MTDEEFNSQRIRVAFYTSSNQHKAILPELLNDAGLDVISKPLTDDISDLKSTSADVILIDASNNIDTEIHSISRLSESSKLPVYIHDGSLHGDQLNTQWAHKLARKLRRMVGTASIEEKGSTPETCRRYAGQKAAENVWILAGSLGAPEALRKFLGAINPDTPVAFIIAQHISTKYMKLLNAQLNQISPFHVSSGQSNQLLCHQQAITVPAGEQLSISQDGHVMLEDTEGGAVYAPSIDDTIDAVLSHYGNRTGVIILSGIGNDGVKGCQRVSEQGGLVWVQVFNSCVVSNLPAKVDQTGIVNFRGNPEELAQELNRHYLH